MKLPITALLLLPLAAAAAQPDDYARGITLQVGDAQPLQELQLPDEVYAGVLRADLGDLRVFNAADTAVPHALCGPASPLPTLQEQPLQVFPLQAATATGNGGLRVDVQTADGSGVQVTAPGASGETALQPQAYVIDARAFELPLQAIRVDGQSIDGASEVQVRVEASEDLDQWRSVVASTTLLRSSGQQQTLERVRIPLPLARYSYLRLERVGGGPPLRILGVIAEAQVPAMPLEPLRFTATPMPSKEAKVSLYDAGRHAPIGYAHLQLPVANMSLQVALASRATLPTDKDPAWQLRWNGEANSVAVNGAAPDALPIRFEPTTDRYWRLQILGGAETLGGVQPQLELAYLPGRLRFLAQGNGPYTLAFGSARAEPSTPACNSLLADVGETERQRLTGMAYAASGATDLGGAEMLTPAPKPTPLRLILLWVTLIVGAGALVLMALSLMKRLREPPAE